MTDLTSDMLRDMHARLAAGLVDSKKDKSGKAGDKKYTVPTVYSKVIKRLT